MNEATRRLNPEIQQLLGGLAEPPKQERTNRRNDGRGFQEEIEQTCGAYNANRQAMIRKVDPPARIVGAHPNRRVIFLPNPFLDYVGTWTARHSRAIFIEAKSGASQRLRLGSGGLTDTQQSALLAWRRAGAAAFVLYQWAGKVALFLPEHVIAFQGRGEKGLPFDVGLPVPRGEGTVIWDFLPVYQKAVFPVPEAPVER